MNRFFIVFTFVLIILVIKSLSQKYEVGIMPLIFLKHNIAQNQSSSVIIVIIDILNKTNLRFIFNTFKTIKTYMF